MKKAHTFHSNSEKDLKEFVGIIARHGWELAETTRLWTCYRVVGSYGDTITEDARRDYLFHQTAAI